MDDLAHRLAMDPIELRLRNEPDRDQTDEPAVLHPTAHRLPPPGGRRRSAGRGATRHRAAMRDGDQLIGIGMAAAGLPHVAQPVRRAGPDQRRRHRRRPVRHQRHGSGHLHVDDPGGRGRPRAAVEPGPVRARRQQVSRAPRRIRVRGPWPASGRRCSPSANMLRDRFVRTRWSIPDRR